ncbi:branched-chain amino acid transport system permease protein [Amycolatopsis sacchari]|uniref:Branched-chain amino acid transport system permease protein n=1 Tax=Amycolatopsis sacchari TaxID=115433 RepID=A0A1I3L3C5_9PSEU|nr:ABC transporter permease [Amycolatopsis sacchari]SFI79233.1 branched-chain amino acid transport system permease protein [Amycolatopsis sacchari]
MGGFLGILIAGVSAGAIYALCALGFTLAFNSSGVLNMFQGVFIVLGGLLTYTGVHDWHLGVPLAVLCAVLVVTLLAAVCQVVVVAPNQHRLSLQNVLLVLLGGLILTQGAATMIWGQFAYSLDPFSAKASVVVGGLAVPTQVLWILGATAVVCLVLLGVLQRTNLGRGLRALAENPWGARALGIRVGRLSLLSFAATGTLGALAGAFVTPYLSVTVGGATNFTVIGIIAISLGGFGSYFGATVGGLVLGLVETFATAYVSSLFGQSVMLVALILILAVRPEGLLRVVRRVRADTVARVAVSYVERAPKALGRPVLAALTLLMALLPLFVPGEAVYYVNIIGITALALIGMDVLLGYLGMLNLGQSAFMAVGGYTSALLMVLRGWSPLPALLAGVLAAVAVAAVFSLVTRRLSPHYLAIVSLAFALLAQALAGQLTVTGGTAGLNGIPPFSVGGLTFDTDTGFYYLVWGLVAVFGFGTLLVVRGRTGRVMKAIAFDPGAASALGADVRRYRHWALLYSAVLAGLAGGLYAMYFQFLAPSMVGMSLSFTLIVSTVVGGSGTLLGPILGGALFTYLATASQSFQTWATVAQGGLIILVLSLAPAGLLGSVLNLIGRLRRPAPAPVAAPEEVLSHAARP